MKISAHVLVKNEASFIWYAVMSVINHVDRVRIWDTGSTDGTKEIIKEIMKIPSISKKIFYEEHNIVNFDEEKMRQLMLDKEEINTFTSVRQEMLNKTSADWFIVVDGDEIWWDDSIKKVTDFIRKFGNEYESIVIPTVNLVGDIYHYQEKQAGRYHLAGRVGHYNLRAINKNIPGLKSLGEHGIWGWADSENKMIQDRDQNKIKYIDAPYLHATHLERAANRKADFNVFKRSFKLKHEIGNKFPLDYYYPEVLFRKRPEIVASPWIKMTTKFYIRSIFETPLRKIKRRVLPAKIGY